MACDDGGFFGDGDWGEHELLRAFAYAVLLAFQRVSLAITAGGFAIAGANMIDKAPILAYLSLGAAGVFGVWVAVAAASGAGAGR
jgi:hypothetical protein